MAAAPAAAQSSSAGLASEPAPTAEPAAGSADVAAAPQLDYDPWQGINRPLYGLGMGIDKVIVKPVTTVYTTVTPKRIRQRVTAFLYNLSEPGTVINDVAQGKVKRAGRATSRFVINSTLGIAGLFDVASEFGIRPHEADFGQTLGRYGAQPGPYVYVPVVGPLNLRDGLGRLVDVTIDPVSALTGGYKTTFGATRLGLTVVDTRAAAQPAFDALKDAIDPYATMRSAYMQNRAFVVQSASGETADLPDFDDPPSQ